ncbi:tRNA uridine(34) 5-carboxymethylaminomethyl modification radical SAM/GNAT enzyme Elp3 [Candidatus Gracilibacteria bacterium]|nr:tRNA uridine(34) 5-carboxymethylaminomethyl modification radical SAM/GNAT enzyme Elp3 [Candidatus Gracilibacteria bacterium]MCF7819016.1 tRNA uridine(34) 5-carboxymethylaminomethyl modification radical SAM/GNAT enzyme Elp3 [Candidatus Gracilibacteria bacterium]
MKREQIFGVRQKVQNPAKVRKFLKELQEDLPRDARELEKRKRAFCAREKTEPILNRDLIAMIQKARAEQIEQSSVAPTELENLLRKRAVRTISGVSPIAILTKPYPCPGKCVYCPTEARMPKSYMSNQPAAARALRNKFHPYDQVHNRISALQDSGHPVSKLEVIVMGGTWSFLPHNYQSWYLKRVYDAANGMRAKNLSEAQKRNETVDKRIIGLTLETRPDFINERELIRMRRYGCTRIEIGVQTLDDEVQKLTKRGHDRRHVIRATKLMRDFGFKICYHLMPGLPGSTPEKDLEWMKEIFENPDFRPDFVKIYPCVVLETAELKSWWEKGEYQPLRDEELIQLLLKFKAFVPPWARIMRLMRDIPVSNILDGAKLSNLRQILKSQPKKLKELVGEEFVENQKVQGWPCQCVRCREIGFADLQKIDPEKDKPVLKRRDYEASDGTETFLSFETEDEKHLFALLRLRRPSGQKFSQFGSVLHDAALIREVHSYGSEISVGDVAGIGQHRGLGRKLIAEAERIARDEWQMKRMTIIAGIGTREYYRKFDYELRATYMTKKL